jgi:branched-chain amino acid transport system substrate-binding protein
VRHPPVRARWPGQRCQVAWAASTLVLLAACASGLTGCGGVGVSGAEAIGGSQLTVYSSLPLQGPSAAITEQIVNGEKLALSQAGGHVGTLRVSYVSLNDSNPASGTWDPGITATNAKTAAQDTSTIAYLGDYNSGATAVSLPLINGAGILQVSPASPYVGLTSSRDAGPGEPARFYPSGMRTFGRLAPGDQIQASAQAQLMRSLGVKRAYVLDDLDPFEAPLAQMVAQDARAAGIEVVGRDSIATTAGAVFTGEVEKIVGSGAQAVFLAGGSGPGPVALWRQLHAAAPQLWLLGPNTMVNDAFTAAIGPAAARTLLTTPALPTDLYPRSAQRVLDAYLASFGVPAQGPALYGYEAMSVVLDAIRRAGARGSDRKAVTDRFFAVRDRRSVIGTYSMQPDGETTLSRYGVDRITNGRPSFWRAYDVH